MKDFRIVQSRVLLPVYSAAPIRGFSPPSIVVVGANLNQVEEILYNEVQVNEFVVSSETRLIVRIPPSQVGKDLFNLKVFSSKPAPKMDAAVILQVGTPVKSVSGMDRLVQAWLMIFMTTPGSDVFTLQSGGGAKSIIGSSTDKSGRSAAADLAVAVQRTEAELIRLQAQTPTMPPEERLLSSEIESISSDDSSGTISARVILRNLINQTSSVSVS